MHSHSLAMARERCKICQLRIQPNVSTQSSTRAHTFMREASLHGLKHITHKDYNFCERAFWVLAFLTSVCLSLYFVSKVWMIIESNPLVLTMETTNEPIRNIEFPAVTICPSQQVLQDKLHALHDQLKQNVSITLHELFEASLTELEFDETEHGFAANPQVDLSTLDSYFRNGSLSYKEVMKSVSPNCSDMIRRCTWKGKKNCAAGLLRLLTPMGYCCTFNFPNMAAHDVKQYTSHYKGKGFGLQLILDPRNNQTANIKLGHKVLVHDRQTFPYRQGLELQVGPGELLHIGLQPVIIQSVEDLRVLSLPKRDCNFPDEYQFTLNITRSYHNCIMDCFSIHQIKQCGCVQSYIQHFHPNATACGLQEKECVKDVLNNIMDNLVEMCDCRPPCEEAIYNTQFTLREITFRDFTLRAPGFLNGDFQNYSMVRVFFKEARFTKFKRSLRYHWEDFIADAGGLLGVGFGFSLLSAVELVYFFCYKFWKPVRKVTIPISPTYVEPWTKMPPTTVNQYDFSRPPCQQSYFQ